MSNINLGVIGYGYWGPNIVRNFFSTPSCTIKMVADGRQERLNLLAKIFPSIKGVKDAEDTYGNIIGIMSSIKGVGTKIDEILKNTELQAKAGKYI